jgi:hypothetical protein
MSKAVDYSVEVLFLAMEAVGQVFPNWLVGGRIISAESHASMTSSTKQIYFPTSTRMKVWKRSSESGGVNVL